MPQVYQTYVSQISNGYSGEQPGIDLLERLSPVFAMMSSMALSGLISGTKKNKLNTQIQQAYAVNKRHANSVISFVAGELDSARKCHERHIEILSAKIKSVKETIDSLEKRFKSHRNYVSRIEKQNLAIKYPTTSKNTKAKKVADYNQKVEFYNACPVNGKQSCKTYLQIAKQQLHQKKRQLKMYLSRRNSVVKAGVKVNLGKLGNISFVGSTGETGCNQICQFYPDNIPYLKMRVPYFLESLFGEYIQLPLYKFNQHGRDEITTSWALNRALTYVFSQNKKGKWVVAITTLVDFQITSNEREFGCIGLDINPSSLGWCATNQHGNPIAWGKVNLDLHSCSTEQTTGRLSEAVTEITTRALASKKP